MPGWWQVFCHCGVSGEVPGGGKFLFSGESKSRTWFYARVGGSVKQSGASSF